ncbi:uncharacterized protein CELE_C07A9.10 [Caenorhabditis elegans]|uniref:Uncharacterized protein C07A9.10 n=1 Tax=Caenorhabditis elegans TaxID=6239 RepID=YKT0_CAEEL|nr:Uncharacterized protein CELE_C07A9.10 [Caenorhabditis elegans]P34321.2 RecName: Full=Uncharacterized protein C07A9.10 [Caenorhabditis elegans]CAA82337.2 Uncharacterized protein CELE_C07A9.10 [Caenorhabditis elegans]
MNVILQLLKRSSFEDHFRTCCVGTIHEELRKILSGEKDVVGDLRRMHSYSKLHKGRNMCTTALKVLMKDLAAECKRNTEVKVLHPTRFKSHLVCSAQGCKNPTIPDKPYFKVALPSGKAFTDMVVQKHHHLPIAPQIF